MKAFRFYQTGGPEVLRFEDVDMPKPSAGEIRIRHEAIAVNFRDILVRRGQHSIRAFPSGLGLESAGMVDAIGTEVIGFSIGDRIACVAGRTAPMPRVASCRRRARSNCRTRSKRALPLR